MAQHLVHSKYNMLVELIHFGWASARMGTKLVMGKKRADLGACGLITPLSCSLDLLSGPFILDWVFATLKTWVFFLPRRKKLEQPERTTEQFIRLLWLRRSWEPTLNEISIDTRAPVGMLQCCGHRLQAMFKVYVKAFAKPSCLRFCINLDKLPAPLPHCFQTRKIAEYPSQMFLEWNKPAYRGTCALGMKQRPREFFYC